MAAPRRAIPSHPLRITERDVIKEQSLDEWFASFRGLDLHVRVRALRVARRALRVLRQQRLWSAPAMAHVRVVTTAAAWLASGRARARSRQPARPAARPPPAACMASIAHARARACVFVRA
jgi:hypothetical protein